MFTLCLPEIDECLVNNADCAHVCDNTEGSYECSCYEPYTLAADGRACLPPPSADDDGEQTAAATDAKLDGGVS